MEVPSFEGQRVAVIGDLIADHYLFAEPRRLSREAPVMVLSHRSEELGAGGAANVARNLASLGARVALFGAVGEDVRGREVLELLDGDGIDISGVAREESWTTPTKTRILAAEPRRSLQQVLRIDREPGAPLGAAQTRALVQRVAARLSELDAVLLSDYEYGALSPALAPILAEVIAAGKTVVLDPRRDFELVPGLSALTPNLGELAQVLGCRGEALDSPEGLAQGAAEVLARSKARWLLATRGNLGMALFGEGIADRGVFVPASGAGEVTDVSGAGDTAAAVFALALASGQSAVGAMELANAASGVVVMEHGAVCCTIEQLREAAASAPSASGREGTEEEEG